MRMCAVCGQNKPATSKHFMLALRFYLTEDIEAKEGGAETRRNKNKKPLSFRKYGHSSFTLLRQNSSLNRQTNELVAIKVLDLDTDDDEITDVQKEITMLSHCDSEYITRYHGSYLNETKLWVIMDYAAGGSMRNIVGIPILAPLFCGRDR